MQARAEKRAVVVGEECFSSERSKGQSVRSKSHNFQELTKCSKRNSTSCSTQAVTHAACKRLIPQRGLDLLRRQRRTRISAATNCTQERLGPKSAKRSVLLRYDAEGMTTTTPTTTVPATTSSSSADDCSNHDDNGASCSSGGGCMMTMMMQRPCEAGNNTLFQQADCSNAPKVSDSSVSINSTTAANAAPLQKTSRRRVDDCDNHDDSQEETFFSNAINQHASHMDDCCTSEVTSETASAAPLHGVSQLRKLSHQRMASSEVRLQCHTHTHYLLCAFCLFLL